ncbi:sensor histidine kinase, partial [Thermodesulfobacteriota bacterium]
RMGERLQYTIELPAHLRDHAFPPMLVQPLVENAVNHGLEPKIGGGEIGIRVEEASEIIRLIVSDTGLGLNGDKGAGFGLSNVRERLEALYEKKGRLMFEEIQPSGLRVTIEIPNERRKGDHS